MIQRKLRYLVLGVRPGSMGEAISYYLLKQADTHSVCMGDIDIDGVRQVAKKLRELTTRDTEILTTYFNADKKENINEIFSGFDAVISAMPARYNLLLAKHAIETGTNFCDLGGVISVTKNILELNGWAKRKGLSVITDNGVEPGMGDENSAYAVSLFKKAREVKVIAGGIPKYPVPPLYYSFPYSTAGLKHVCKDSVHALVSGRIVVLPPFSDHNLMTIPRLAKYSPDKDGVVEVFQTAGASTMPWQFQKMGLERFSEMTLRYKGFVEKVRAIPYDNFEKEIFRLYPSKPTSKENPDLLYFRVEVTGLIDGKEKIYRAEMLEEFDPQTELSAMQKTTGFNAGMIATMQARGLIRPGALTPTQALTNSQLKSVLEQSKKLFPSYTETITLA